MLKGPLHLDYILMYAYNSPETNRFDKIKWDEKRVCLLEKALRRIGPITSSPIL